MCVHRATGSTGGHKAMIAAGRVASVGEYQVHRLARRLAILSTGRRHDATRPVPAPGLSNRAHCRWQADKRCHFSSGTLSPPAAAIDRLLEFAAKIDRNEERARTRLTFAHEPSSDKSAIKERPMKNIASDFCQAYLDSDPISPVVKSESDPSAGREAVVLHLVSQCGVDYSSLDHAIGMYHEGGEDMMSSQRQKLIVATSVHKASEAKYIRFFNHILSDSVRDVGLFCLLQLRNDVRTYSRRIEQKEKGTPEDILLMHRLRQLDNDLKALLSVLFLQPMLGLRRISYESTPACIIEKIARKEAVHPLQSLDDLRTRLGPDRRCFAFFHPSLPDEPLVFVHVGLLSQVPETMSAIESLSTSKPNVATFYSITNTQPGLSGIDLGNFLIKRVVAELQRDFPGISTFCTLSPIPRFIKWLEHKLLGKEKFFDSSLLSESDLESLANILACSAESAPAALVQLLKDPTWIENENVATALKPPLMKLAAHYLSVEKHRGKPIDGVAKFHCRNGAEMFRLNYLADTSRKGMHNSAGMMINYRYDLDSIEMSNMEYELVGVITVQKGVSKWLG